MSTNKSFLLDLSEVLQFPNQGLFLFKCMTGNQAAHADVLRARYLTDAKQNTMIFTYTKTLANYVSNLIPACEKDNIVVFNYDQMIVSYLKEIGIKDFKCFDNIDNCYLVEAINQVKEQHSSLNSSIDDQEFIGGEIAWLVNKDINSIEDYLSIKRRSCINSLLTDEDKHLIFKIKDNYESILNELNDNNIYDWAHIRKLWSCHILDNNISCNYKHVVLVANRDISLHFIRALRSAVCSNGSLTVILDSAQCFLCEDYSLLRFGFTYDSERGCSRHTGNTYEIIKLAASTIKGVLDINFDKYEQPSLRWHKPFLMKSSSIDNDILSLYNRLKSSSLERVCFLAFTRTQEARLVKLLDKAKIISRGDNKQELAPDSCCRFFISTISSANGLDFDAVVIPYLDDLIDSSNKTNSAIDKGEMSYKEATHRISLFTGLTCSKKAVFLLYEQEFTPLLPSDMSLYEVFDLNNNFINLDDDYSFNNYEIEDKVYEIDEQVAEVVSERKITSLCHFTSSLNLPYIFADNCGIRSASWLKEHGYNFHNTDPNRYDQKTDHICCSCSFPNIYYFDCVKKTTDFVVLFIDPSYISRKGNLYCPGNASKASGQYCRSGVQGFEALFQDNVNGFTRRNFHTDDIPTDIQAEILVLDHIDVEGIKGIVCLDEEHAKREIKRLKLLDIDIDVSFFIQKAYYSKAEFYKYFYS